MDKKIEKYDVVIIGGGAAGLTAGIYCGRARLKTLLIEKTLVGGLATYTSEIENYPGFPEGTTGMDLMNLFHKQATKYGVKFKLTDVKSVDFCGVEKVVDTFRTRYLAKTVVIASGGKPRLTHAANEDKFLYDKGISFCATCDAASNTGKTVMVIGSGDAAIEEGLFLTKFADQVIVSVMHSKGKMDCNEIARNQALSNPKMRFIWDTIVDHYEGGEVLETVVLKNVKTNELISVKVDSCFLFIGYEPNTEIFQNKINLSAGGYVCVNEKMETNVPGVFGVGDVCDKYLKQVATAVGDGAIAGFSVEKYIAELEVFKMQILNEGKPSLVYLYNAVDDVARGNLLTIEKFEEKYFEKISVTRVDVYKSNGIANRLNVNRVPCTVYLNKGVAVKAIYGKMTLDELEDLIK